MSEELVAPTLLEDWQQRKAELEAADAPSGSQQALLQLLDYLIARYRGKEDVQRPALFPRHSSLTVNERAVIVHQHLGQRLRPRVSNRSDAEKRVQSSLQRLAAHQADPERDRDDSDETVMEFGRSEFTASNSLWAKLIKKLRAGRRADRLIEKALKQSPFLPATALNHLFQRIDELADIEALHFLLRCHNRSIPNYIRRVWRRRVICYRQETIDEKLHQFWLAPEHRERKREAIRIALADEHAAVRRAAIAVLGEIGDLDDVSLLSDLLRVPTTTDEHPAEDVELAAAIQRIAEHDEEFEHPLADQP